MRGHGNTQTSSFLTRREVADYARCSVRTVWRAEALGHLRAVRRPGSRAVLYEAAEVRRWLCVGEQVLDAGEGVAHSLGRKGQC